MSGKNESIDLEKKSRYSGTTKERLELVKTIVAMANTKGGEITIRELVGITTDSMDSARLDDLVNKYIQPRIENIRSSVDKKGKVRIKVESSSRKPHVFVHEASYEDNKGRRKSAFFPGQVYVRHSSKTEPATADDFNSMIRTVVSSWFSMLASSVESFSMEIGRGGFPVYPSDEPSALQISIKDINEEYPYTAKTLGRVIGKNQNWVAKAAQVLGLKENKIYCQPVKGATGEIALYKYSKEAAKRLEEETRNNPEFNPYCSL